MQQQQKNLFLILKKEWFEMIEANIKKQEYREVNNYWVSRLLNDLPNAMRFKKFDTVIFQLGYSKKRRVVLECKGITIGTGLKKWGALPGKKYFKIHLGKILSQSNNSNAKSNDV